MSRANTILGIETSCDETALTLLERRVFEADEKSTKKLEAEYRVIASLVHSQAELHSVYGGVYPNLAKREHGKNILPLLHKLLIKVNQTANDSSNKIIDFKNRLKTLKDEVASQNPELYETFANADFLEQKPNIDAIAVTEGPGLEPALWVGITFAKILGSLWNIPVIPIDHMEGHIVGSLIKPESITGQWSKLYDQVFPSVAILLSGGHTELVHIHKLGKYEILGETKDDAVGEAFDKAARLLGLPYPGGPHLSLLAAKAREEKITSPIRLPRPMLDKPGLDFSFSGLKTAVLYAVRKAPRNQSAISNNPDNDIDETWKKGLAREFEDAVTETLDTKLRRAIEKIDAKSIIIGGGVSANKTIRAQFTITAADYGIPILLPHADISGDNAIMIALAGMIKTSEDKGPIPSQSTSKQSELRARGTRKLTD